MNLEKGISSVFTNYSFAHFSLRYLAGKHYILLLFICIVHKNGSM